MFQLGPDSAALALKDPVRAGIGRRPQPATFELRLGDQWFSAQVSDGRFEITRGEPDRADATIKTDPSTLAGVLWHGRSIRQAVRTGELELQGNRVLADAFLRLFPLPEASKEETAAARGHQR